MGLATIGQAVFAATLIGLGLLGLVSGDFAPMQPVPKALPGREFLVYLCALLPLITGVGLLFRRTAGISARVLLAGLLLWLVLVRVPALVGAPTSIDKWFGVAETAVYAAAAWVLHALFTGKGGLRVAQILYGLPLILFGIAHFVYVNETASLVPAWLPAHLPIAYLTGATYIAAGVAILAKRLDRWAAILSTVQMGGFTVLVWFPIVTTGAPSPFTWSEFVVSITLTASAWVVAETYRIRDRPRLRGQTPKASG
jgi:uncharacterized membrane protein